MIVGGSETNYCDSVNVDQPVGDQLVLQQQGT